MGDIKDNIEVEKIKNDINKDYNQIYVKMPLKDLPKVIEDLKKKVNPISETIVVKYKSELDKFEKLYNNLKSKPFDSFKLEIKKYLLLYESLKTIKGLRYASHVSSVRKEYDKIMEKIEKKIKEIKSDFTETGDDDLYDILYNLLKNPQENDTITNESTTNEKPIEKTVEESNDEKCVEINEKDTSQKTESQDNENFKTKMSITNKTKKSSKISPE